METEIIDKLFLELAQITKAKTPREMELESQQKGESQAVVIYAKLGEGRQMRMDLTYLIEGLPAPFEKSQAVDVKSAHIREAIEALKNKQYQPVSYFPED